MKPVALRPSKLVFVVGVVAGLAYVALRAANVWRTYPHTPILLLAGSVVLGGCMGVLADRGRPLAVVGTGALAFGPAVAAAIVTWTMRPGEHLGELFVMGLCMCLVVAVTTVVLFIEALRQAAVRRAQPPRAELPLAQAMPRRGRPMPDRAPSPPG